MPHGPLSCIYHTRLVLYSSPSLSVFPSREGGKEGKEGKGKKNSTSVLCFDSLYPVPLTTQRFGTRECLADIVTGNECHELVDGPKLDKAICDRLRDLSYMPR